MSAYQGSQVLVLATGQPVTSESVVPNPKLKLLDQIREVMRLKHYSLRTERSSCDWVRRFVQFHMLVAPVPPAWPSAG